MYKSLTFVALLMALIISQSAASPRLTVIGGQTIDLGTIKPTMLFFQAKAQIVNTGNDHLVIDSIITEDNDKFEPLPTIVGLTGYAIAPGDTANLQVNINITGLVGNITRKVLIISNDPKHKKQAIKLKANVVRPMLKFDGGSTYNWGTVKPADSPLKTKIKIINDGNDTLSIPEVHPGCGCTTAPLDRNNIEPGGFATVDVTLNVGGHPGSLTKQIYFKSNDPEKRNTTFSLKADVFVAVTANPNYFGFYGIKKQVEASTTITLHNNLDKPIEIKQVEVTQEGLSVTIKEGDIIPAHGDLQLVGKITPINSKPINGKVKLVTDCTESPVVELYVWGDVLSDNN